MDVTEVTELPECDIHRQRGEHAEAMYDGATTFGPWAYMCQPCMDAYGVGLGTGRGQRLVLRTA